MNESQQLNQQRISLQRSTDYKFINYKWCSFVVRLPANNHNILLMMVCPFVFTVCMFWLYMVPSVLSSVTHSVFFLSVLCLRIRLVHIEMANNAEDDTKRNQVSSWKYFITVIIWSMIQWPWPASSKSLCCYLFKWVKWW